MLEQVSTSVKFLAFFTASKQGKTELTVTIDIYDPSGSQIVTAGSATALGGGLYSYTLSTDNSSEGEYAAIFKTTDSTVDAQHIPSLWVLGRAGVENLDAATSTRLPSSSYTAPTAAPTVTAIRQEMDSNSTKLANLDAAVSTRSTLTAAQVNAEADTALADVGLTTTITGRIDQAISTRLASASYTAPANSDIAAVKAKTDLLETTRLAQCSTVATTGAQLAAALS
jgi:hypothetical protein